MIIASGGSALARASIDTVDIDSALGINAGEWYHICFAADRDKNGTVYVNGRILGTPASINGDNMATTATLLSGKNSYDSSDYFDGKIDSARIFNRTLSETEIKMLYGNFWVPDDTRETRDFYTQGNVSADNFNDFTPAWDKSPMDALNELVKVSSEIDTAGNVLIDHDSLPEFTRARIIEGTRLVNCANTCDGDDRDDCLADCDVEYIYKEGRNIGATVTMLVEAIKALNEQNSELKAGLCKHDPSYDWC